MPPVTFNSLTGVPAGGEQVGGCGYSVPSTIVLGSTPVSHRGRFIETDDDDPEIASPLASTATHKAVVGHDIAVRSKPAKTGELIQLDLPPVGSDEISEFPFPSTATQKVAIGHEIEDNQVLSTPLNRLQDEPPELGEFETRMFPLVSVAAQKLIVGQLIESIDRLASTFVATFHCAPVPCSGSVLDKISPTWSTATHRFKLGHEMEFIGLVLSTDSI